MTFGDPVPWNSGGGGGGWYSGNAWYATTTSNTVTPYYQAIQIYPAPATAAEPVPEPKRPQFDDELEWLRGRVQDVVDIFDRVAV